MIHCVPFLLAAAVGLAALPPEGGAEAFAPAPSTTSTAAALSSRASTFNYTARPSFSSRRSFRNSVLFSSRVTFTEEVETKDDTFAFDPLGYSGGWSDSSPESIIIDGDTSTRPYVAAAPLTLAISTLVLSPDESHAASAPLSTGDFNPDTFKPVCAASDSFYRLLQASTRAVVGDENFSEYGPLIAGGLLRVRLELCVVESFFNEAVGPFVKENGLNWILPWHETVETFLAGTIFALATTFILVGSTKLIQIIAFYGDLVVGGPCRLFGGFLFDRARGEPVTLDVSFFGFWKTRLVGPPVDFKEEERIRKAGGGEVAKKLVDFDKVKPTDIPVLFLSGGIKVVGEASKIFREFIEGLDLFVGRYLVLIASGYIILKFVHFKVFPDFP